MELIRRAIERAQTGKVSTSRCDNPDEARLRRITAPSVNAFDQAPLNELALSRSALEAHRIVTHDLAHPMRKSFDILRTQVLQAMDDKNFHLLAVTSATPGCGKTVTAINLALSIARHAERSVMLVDMDLQRPRVANYLGVACDRGIIGVLEGRAAVPEATIHARIGSLRFSALLAEGATEDSSKWMTSRVMSDLLRDIRQICASHVVIIDLPPMLTSDDVLAILPHMDCALFVAAAGLTTTSEIKECTSHLQSIDVLRIVLNKASETNPAYTAAGY